VKPGIRLAVFDLGRVLVPICDNWQHAATVARIPVPLPKLDDDARATLRTHVHDNECGKLGLGEFCRRAAAVFGVDPQHIESVSNVYLLGVFPGVEKLLSDLIAADCTTACLSNTNDNHWRIMFSGESDYAPLNHLQHRFGSHLIGLRKPNTKIYEHVEQQTHLSGPQIVFFDDLLENIQAACQRGWHAEQILPGENPVTQMRQHLIRLNVLRDT
jgi:putative hydrolase of the HAD superfamily